MSKQEKIIKIMEQLLENEHFKPLSLEDLPMTIDPFWIWMEIFREKKISYNCKKCNRKHRHGTIIWEDHIDPSELPKEKETYKSLLVQKRSPRAVKLNELAKSINIVDFDEYIQSKDNNKPTLRDLYGQLKDILILKKTITEYDPKWEAFDQQYKETYKEFYIASEYKKQRKELYEEYKRSVDEVKKKEIWKKIKMGDRAVKIANKIKLMNRDFNSRIKKNDLFIKLYYLLYPMVKIRDNEKKKIVKEVKSILFLMQDKESTIKRLTEKRHHLKDEDVNTLIEKLEQIHSLEQQITKIKERICNEIMEEKY